MRFWTAHLHDRAAPILLREGFSWPALLFGPLWLAWGRAWIAAALDLAATILILALTSGTPTAVLLLGQAILLGLSGNDLRRWTAQLRGYRLTQVVAAHTETEALGRLLARRPDLAGRFLPPEHAR